MLQNSKNFQSFSREITIPCEIIVFLHGPMTWKVVQGNAWKDISNWQTKQLNSYTKSQHHALTTINSKRKT